MVNSNNTSRSNNGIKTTAKKQQQQLQLQQQHHQEQYQQQEDRRHQLSNFFSGHQEQESFPLKQKFFLQLEKKEKKEKENCWNETRRKEMRDFLLERKVRTGTDASKFFATYLFVRHLLLHLLYTLYVQSTQRWHV